MPDEIIDAEARQCLVLRNRVQVLDKVVHEIYDNHLALARLESQDFLEEIHKCQDQLRELNGIEKIHEHDVTFSGRIRVPATTHPGAAKVADAILQRLNTPESQVKECTIRSSYKVQKWIGDEKNES